MAPRACRISAPSAKWRAPPWCAAPSRLLCDIPTRLLCFSDDMDGMRKIPENVPDRKVLEPYLHMPLTAVPDPFGGSYPSFGDHNNAMLRRFLDTFGFDYEFASATEYYKSGRFDDDAAARARALRRHHGGDAADAGRGAAGHLLALPADLAQHRPRALRADEGGERQGRHHHLRRRGRARRDHPGHRRPHQAAVEARLRHALGRTRRRLRDVRQGSPDQRADL